MRRRQGSIRTTDPRTGRESFISEDELDQRGVVQSLTDDGKSQKLWDVIDETWGRPLPRELIEHYLGKWVFKCSACRETSWRSGMIEGHVEQARSSGIEHMGMTVREGVAQDGVTRVSMCTGCGYSNALQPVVQHHIDDRIRAVEPHQGAYELRIHRFVRESSASPVPPVAILSLPEDKGVPIARQENGAAPRPRGRRRRHNRGRRHGSSTQA